MQQETHNITWRGIEIEIIFTPEKYGVVDHIELRSMDKTPLPITETGYRSEYLSSGSVSEYGGAIAYVTDWLDDEAKRISYEGVQLSLF